MEKSPFDIVIVGAGAAGLTTAIAAGRGQSKNLKILLVDSRGKVGAKILVSGGTRCNVTNRKVTPFDFQGGPSHFIKHVLEAFTPDQTKRFFEEIGVDLILESTGKYFPVTRSGKTVLEALLKESEKCGVSLKTGFRVTGIEKKGDVFLLRGETGDLLARRVVLATGGLSLPETGSDGMGLSMAASLGHTLIKTTPALTPLTTNDKDWMELSGITLNAALTFFEDGKKKAECEGSLLFTHFGYSGPVALDISRFFAYSDPKHSPEIEANFLPGHTPEALNKRLEIFRKKHPNKQPKSFFIEEFGLPERFVETFLRKNEGKNPRQLLHPIAHTPLSVTGVVGYRKAEVTAGGVDLKEVRVSTMESKIIPGLYFAGEILDVDGRIGGFNFQWSWSSGTVAGRSAVLKLP
ncbi:MAG: NAD(P)/FAD-dependent oxidoreductase [Candidatus Omnitrophica bacterium]|nr:NAD(P)/FAD-dependent oxidoreductase [Candidatus Omnitrophota bacterium]